ncbi:MAG: lytic transglycosylase domain-containing protein [Proteobacteria bacterium]|nr:lytic transglycosylase domain-containing protein [Pseudomonadota bacterium]
MRPFILLVAVLMVVAFGRASARAEGCLAAAANAERQYDIPSGLLAAIGEAESGRRDPVSGRVTPWPWTIDAAGNGLYLPDATAATRKLDALISQRVGLIDVGCFQIDLAYHPDAFPTLADAFDPDANAEYAARFLAGLYHRLGSWAAAVAAYHSQAPALGAPYKDHVLSLWHGVEPPEQRFGMTVWTPQSTAAEIVPGQKAPLGLPHIIVPMEPVSGG